MYLAENGLPIQKLIAPRASEITRMSEVTYVYTAILIDWGNSSRFDPGDE